MGENAMFQGRRIKIGTCEEMYYLRADQASRVQCERGSVNPRTERFALRFRFPWPDEDLTAPGDFDNCDRELGVYGVGVPDEVEHMSVQFSNNAGFLVSLPCPLSSDGLALAKREGFTFHKNGYSGDVRIVQQRWVPADEQGPERLCTILKCGGCRTKFRLDTYEDAKPIIEALRKEAKSKGWEEELSRQFYERDKKDRKPVDPDKAHEWTAKVAERIEAGYRGKFR